MAQERGWIFFDIDGTLLYARGSGREAFRQAFDEAFGWDQGVEHVNFFGATDLDVFRKLCVERGEESTPEMEQAFFDCLAPALDERLAQNPPEVFPNVEPILKEVSKQWTLGIVTGNIEATAKLKLKHAGLLEFFDERGFGCGCDHEDRIEIARHAWERAGKPKRTVLIGDTPSDIHAAKSNGMVSIAVATGGFDFPSLEKADADFVFQDLTDTNRLLSILNEL